MTIYKYRELSIDTESLTREDMPNNVFVEIFDLCGVDVAMPLLLNMRGNLIQVPTNGMRNIEKRIILKDYDGTTSSIRSIARKFGITEGYIRAVLSENRIKPPNPNQMDLF